MHTARDVVGRDEERDILDAVLDRRAPGSGPAGVALEGEAGIGKSTLWREAVDLARARGLRVLTARPVESERTLAHAGLGDLFDDVLDDVLPGLPPPRRRALEVALLLEEAGSRPVDPLALGVAVRSALELLAAGDGLVVAVDDLQWLDSSSAAALGFALRRLRDRRARRLDAAARRGRRADRGRGGARPRPDRARPRRAAERRRDPPRPQRPARACRCRARRCSGCTRPRAGTRCTPSSSRGRSATRTRCATRRSRCRCPGGWRSSSRRGSTRSPARRARRSCSSRRSRG